MRGFAITLVIFILIIAGLFFYSSYMTQSLNDLSSLLYTAELNLNEKNFSSAYTAAVNFSDALVKKSYTLYYFTDRCPIDNAVVESERLKSFIKAEDDAESAAVLSGLKLMISKIEEKSRLKIYNVL